MQLMQPSRRPSVSSHSSLHSNSNNHNNSNKNQENKQPQQIVKYIDHVRGMFKSHMKSSRYQFGEQEINDGYNMLVLAKKYLLLWHKENNDAMGEYKNQVKNINQNHEEEKKGIKERLQEEIQFQQRQFNQKILSINNQNGRKEQSYKEIIERLMKTLTLAQKQQQNIQSKFNQQMSSVTKTLKNVLNHHQHQGKISTSIKAVVQQIRLRQQNSMISSKSADQLSLDEILPASQIAMEQKDSGMIEHHSSQDCWEVQIQVWLQKLTCFGFFQQKNQKLIKKMLQLTKRCEQPSQLLQNNIFPVIKDLLLDNMRGNEEKGWRYLKGLSGISCCEQQSRIQLRNISNLSQLQVNSACEVSIGDGIKPHQKY